MTDQKLLRVPQVAKIFNVSRPTIYRMVNAGKLPAYSISDSVRIPAEAVSEYLNSHKISCSGAGKLQVDTEAQPNIHKPIDVPVTAEQLPADMGAKLSVAAEIATNNPAADQANIAPQPKPRKKKKANTPTAEMLLQRKAWKMARLLAIKLLPADATAAQWDKVMNMAYKEAMKKLGSASTNAKPATTR